jgi:hypothetical protein
MLQKAFEIATTIQLFYRKLLLCFDLNGVLLFPDKHPFGLEARYGQVYFPCMLRVTSPIHHPA